MPSTISRTVHLPARPERVWEHVQTPRLMQYVGKGLVRFAPAGGKRFPDKWTEGEHKAWLYLFGIIPLGWQVIGIELPPGDGPGRQLRDNGHSPLIRRWDHRIIIEPEGTGTRYTDSIAIEAGFLRPVIARAADIFFAHRQRRLKAIAERDFVYPD